MGYTSPADERTCANVGSTETGWTPKTFTPSIPKDYDPSDKDSAASMPTFTVAAALATFIGGVALL